MTFLTRILLAASLCAALVTTAHAQPIENRKYGQEDKFRQLEEILPTPNGYRNAAGAPGPEYWQQRADYDIDIALDDENQHLTGREKITYYNNSPHPLNYIWLQVDANIFSPESDSRKLQSYVPSDRISTDMLKRMAAAEAFDGGAKITRVADSAGNSLDHTLVQTMLRIELPTTLQPSESFKFEIDWNYKINDSDISGGRTGCEFFTKDGNYIYEIAQWFPRMVAFTDATGWQHKQYLGSGEFTLELGDYIVRITVPEDHVVASTGVLQNAGEVLTPEQQERLESARTASRPKFVVTPEEALENQKEKSTGKKTWVFHAQNVRDFAWASSRKFIWDAQGHNVEGNPVMAMSFYPNEGEPLWSKYSTHSIIHTLDVYSRYTFAYPYPIAISVNGPVGGMEYPMICFNGPRPEEDGTYSSRTKYGLISVIIHEVGHNYFPMIVNTDERQWTWMDEGINTFLQYLAEQEWEEDYPSPRGEPAAITGYMLSSNQMPIMTNSESILQFGNNAYAKPATALNILRETVLGRELFDYAFKEYARRWKFKRPMPADFFRTMEDASGVDLDWFWRGWFYSTDHVDIAIDQVQLFQIDNSDPDAEAERKRKEKDDKEPSVSDERNQSLRKRIDWQAGLKDFYNSPAYDELAVEESARKEYQKFLDGLDKKERAMLRRTTNFYVVTFKNVGGLVMPIIVRVHYADNTSELMRIPVDIWRSNGNSVNKLIVTEKEITRLELDPKGELADTEDANNHWPPKIVPSRFKLFKDETKKNPMQKVRDKDKEKDESDSTDGATDETDSQD